jgi:tellurite resistance protein
MTSSTAAPRTPPLPLALFAVPLGLAGLGGAWAAAETVLGAPRVFEEIAYGLSAILWLGLAVFYLWQGLWDGGSFVNDLKHPGTGPFTSFIPLVGILLAAHYSRYALTAGTWVCVLFIAALTFDAARLFAHWATGGVTMEAIHPGYVIPLVAGAFVSSIGFSSVHAHQEAIAAFGVGAFFWPVLIAVVTTRLMAAGPLPIAIRAGLSAFLATAGTANVAWLVAHPGPIGPIQQALTGVLVMMLIIQLAFLAEYRRLPFTMAFWVFTFPVTVTGGYAVRWFGVSGLAVWRPWAWTALAIATATVLAIGARSVVFLSAQRRSA